MTKSMMVHEFKMMLRNKKNILFIIALVSLILTYALLILPMQETPDSFDAEEMKKEISNLEAVTQGMINRGGTGYGEMTGSPFASNMYSLKVQSRMVNAFEDKNFNRFVQLRMKGFDYNTTSASRDWMLIGDAPYPGLDDSRNYSLTDLRYQGYLDANIPITYEMIEQKTALQTITNFLLGTTAFIVLFCAIYFSSDMLAKDRQHRTILQGLPIGWYRLINVKSAVAFGYTLLILFGLLLLAAVIISIQSGFGSFKLSVPITLPSSEPDEYFGYRFSEFDSISIAKFLLLALGIIPILIYLFIRLNALLSLLFKNAWIVLMVSTLILFTERIYYSRTLTELFGIEISNLPLTYFDFGRVISGEKYYLVHLESITYEKGILVLLCTILFLEISLFVVSRIVSKRRFYRKAA
ncbi:ABC transporter permease subunit [Ornithinibacillus sp. FSL M8-0202]|uniref:ABC transporter permease subunit n=1 Tax=Ornithinibacillus sp. FSL M8-0202 TaxID=2921616 RepID=UPI0030D61637